MKTALLLIVLLAGCEGSPAPALACQYDTQIRWEAARQGVEPWLAVAICHAESSGNPEAEGKGGEYGLFQLTPEKYGALPGQQGQRLKVPVSVQIDLGVRNLALARFLGAKDARQVASYHNSGRLDWWNLDPKWSFYHPNRIYRRIYRGEVTQ